MPGLLRGIARTAIVAGTATAVANRVSRRQADRWAQQQQPPPPSATDEEALLGRLSELGELKSRGLLTEEEFTMAKRRILGQDPYV